MKYPLDEKTFSETIAHLVNNQTIHSAVIQNMSVLLEDATFLVDKEVQTDWHLATTTLLSELKSIGAYHETRRFNEANGHTEIPQPVQQPILDAPESDFGGEMSEDELAKMFKERPKMKVKEKPLKEWTMDEIESWEKAQENSNDIYKVAARVKNLARGSNASLTQQGEMLCNTYVHVLMDLYQFASHIEDDVLRINLTRLIKGHEGMPGTLIAAAGAGVNVKKKT